MGKKNAVKKIIMNSPRLNVLHKEFFSKTAKGEFQAPDKGWHEGDDELLKKDAPTMDFRNNYIEYMGVFEKHFSSSVPHILENECRVGCAITRFAKNNNLSGLYSLHLGSSEGPLAKSIASMSKGRVKTLAHSDTPEHGIGFHSTPVPDGSNFTDLPSCDINISFCKKVFGESFSGFDFIFEHQLFQFYSDDREPLVELFSSLLNKNGVFFYSEKFNNEFESEYVKRESVKDRFFKSRYFSDMLVQEKDKLVCERMSPQQVTKSDFIEILKKNFKYIGTTWNSTNFSQVMACNNENVFRLLFSELCEPLIYPEFVFEELPVFYGIGNKSGLKFRSFIEESREGNLPEK